MSGTSGAGQRLVRCSVAGVVVCAILAASACSGGNDAVPEGEDSDAISEEDLLGLLPALSELPAGWIRSADEDEDDDSPFCEQINDLEDFDDLGLPNAGVDYESSGGDEFRTAAVTVFGSETEAIEDNRQRLDAFFDPECAEVEAETDGIMFRFGVSEASTGSDDLDGVLVTLSLAEDADGYEEGTTFGNIFGVTTVVGRCLVAASFGSDGLFSMPPSESEIDEWVTPIVANVNGFDGCAP